MLNTTYKNVLLVLLSFIMVTTAVAQIDTPEKRISRINFLHEKIFEIDTDLNYVKSEAFFQIEQGRDSIAQNYPNNQSLKQSEFSPEALFWATKFEQEADAYITYLEIFIRKQRL